MKAESRSTCVFIVANSLLRRTLALFGLDLLLQNRNCLVLGREISCKLLEHRLIRGLGRIQKRIRVEIVVGAFLIRLVLDVGAPANEENAREKLNAKKNTETKFQWYTAS